jgi:hypothetical protein
MMKNSRQIVLAVLLSLSIALLAGCKWAEVRAGARVDLPNRIADNYSAFTGDEVKLVRAKAGQTLVLDYDVTVDRGTLEIRVEDPAGDAVWELAPQESVEDTVELELENDGRYAVVIEGEEMAGSFDVSWELE